MYDVTIEIGASASSYWGKVEFLDKKGKTHVREISREHQETKQSNILRALIECLKVLQAPCMLNIYSDEDYLVSAFQYGWLNDWQKHDWKNKKGHTVRNDELWKQVWRLMSPHSRRVMKCQRA